MVERKLYSVIFTVLIVGLTVMAAATPTLAGQANSRAANGQFFIGFWQGIDPLDGSTVQLSITDNDQDGEFDFLLRESFHTVCFTGENTLGRGFLIGTAIVVERGVIEVAADIICVNDDNSQEDPEEFIIRARAAPKGDILIFPKITLHRIGG